MLSRLSRPEVVTLQSLADTYDCFLKADKNSWFTHWKEIKNSGAGGLLLANCADKDYMLLGSTLDTITHGLSQDKNGDIYFTAKKACDLLQALYFNDSDFKKIIQDTLGNHNNIDTLEKDKNLEQLLIDMQVVNNSMSYAEVWRNNLLSGGKVVYDNATTYGGKLYNNVSHQGASLYNNVTKRSVELGSQIKDDIKGAVLTKLSMFSNMLYPAANPVEPQPVIDVQPEVQIPAAKPAQPVGPHTLSHKTKPEYLAVKDKIELLNEEIKARQPGKP